MSGYLGPIAQLGYVVRNLDSAMNHWSNKMGIGPFFVVRDLLLPEIVYRGTRQPLTMSVAYSHSGGTQIELIEPSQEPSIYREFLDANGQGVQHVGYMADDYGAALDAVGRAGFAPLQSGAFGGTSFAYFDTGSPECGACIEIMETSPDKWRRFHAIEQAACDWDGADPVRAILVSQLNHLDAHPAA